MTVIRISPFRADLPVPPGYVLFVPISYSRHQLIVPEGSSANELFVHLLDAPAARRVRIVPNPGTYYGRPVIVQNHGSNYIADILWIGPLGCVED